MKKEKLIAISLLAVFSLWGCRLEENKGQKNNTDALEEVREEQEEAMEEARELADPRDTRDIIQTSDSTRRDSLTRDFVN